MKHLALIMDGNRRWARANKLSALMGHDNGANTLKDIARAVAEQGIPSSAYLLFQPRTGGGLQRRFLDFFSLCGNF